MPELPERSAFIALVAGSRLSVVQHLAIVLLLLTVVPVVASAADDKALPSVVVTTEVLGSVVAELVEKGADVTVLMSGGVDPHSWRPSARDTESVFKADFVVSNGLMLEEGLVSILEQAAAEGVRVFEATDHVTLRALDDTDHDHGADDPHFWLDPLAMRDVVVALGPQLAEAGVEVDVEVDRLAANLESLDAELMRTLSTIPHDQRKIVTGHDSLGYFADRYDFEIVGTIIPGMTTSLEPSARDLADLIGVLRDEGVKAAFTEAGTPRSVAEVVADETGARLIELEISKLPESGSYSDLLGDVAKTVAQALAP
jgi:zinc/manganese transport system substrate-binding protein